MNYIEVFEVEYASEIKSTVNNYCRNNMVNPISVSVTEYGTNKDFFITVVVEPMKEAWE